MQQVMDNIRDIELPQLNDESMVTCYAQQRPRRNGGYLIHKEKVGDKLVVHNYGHGGAGVSLAPGCAIQAVSISQDTLKQCSSVAVIGSGVIGLFTCYELFKKFPNIKITIYASSIPSFGQKDNDKMITSQVAPGLWFPFHYGKEKDAVNQRIASLSFQHYQQLSKDEQYKHIVKEVDVYDLSDEKEMQEEYSNNLFPEIEHTYKQVKVRLNAKTVITCRTLSTIKIDMQPFLKIFMSELATKGVSFIQANIDQKALSALPHTLIFNCTGLNSRYLFKDQHLKGVKGHLVQYNNPNPQKYNFILTANIGKQMVDYYMHESRILLGLTEEDVDNCKVDPSQIKMLQQAHWKVLQKYGICPQQGKL